jgi:hypothetical protein
MNPGAPITEKVSAHFHENLAFCCSFRSRPQNPICPEWLLCSILRSSRFYIPNRDIWSHFHFFTLKTSFRFETWFRLSNPTWLSRLTFISWSNQFLFAGAS